MADEQTGVIEEVAEAGIEAEAPAPEALSDDDLGAIFDKANDVEQEQERDEKGRFATKAVEDAPGDTPDGEGAGEEQPADDKGAAPEALEPPASWSAAATASWAGLARDVQEDFLRVEGERQTADVERSNRLKGYEPIDAALEPVRQHLQLNGVDAGQYVGQLVAADRMLRDPRTREQAVQWIVQQYGIDLSRQQAESNADPALAPFVQEINSLKGQVSSFVESQQAQERARLDGEIAAFSKDRPHFEKVRKQMGALIQSGAAPDMPAAYDMAVWADPSIRTAMQAEQAKEADVKRKAEAEDKAAKARRVSQTNLSTQGTSGGATPPQYKDQDEELGAIYERVQGA